MASGLDVQGQFTAARPEYGFNLIRWLPVGFVMRLSLRTLMVSAMLGMAALGSGPAWADDDDDERISVQEEVRRGQILPFETIFGRIRSENRGEYVGAQYDRSQRVYRFRFVDNGNLVNVDVDARTGQRLNRRRAY